MSKKKELFSMLKKEDRTKLEESRGSHLAWALSYGILTVAHIAMAVWATRMLNAEKASRKDE